MEKQRTKVSPSQDRSEKDTSMVQLGATTVVVGVMPVKRRKTTKRSNGQKESVNKGKKLN